MTPHDWITVAGLILGSGGGWRILGKLERFIEKVDRIERSMSDMGRTVTDLARSHRQVIKQQERLVNRVNDHEARLLQDGR